MPPTDLSSLHLPTLLVAVVAVSVSAAGMMTFVGSTQRVYRGFWLWVAAQWLLTLGLTLLLTRESAPSMVVPAILLVMQWPILMLAGVRRFYVRTSFPVSQSFDFAVLALAFLLWWGAWSGGAGQAARTTGASLGSLVLHGYAFWLLLHVREWRNSATLKGLMMQLLLIALLQLPRLLLGLTHWSEMDDSLDQKLIPWTFLFTICAVMFSLYLCVLLTYERTERGLEESQRQLRVLANYDMLTQVPNRRHFNDLAIQALQLAPPGTAALMLFDIDSFKEINDMHGHAAGDEALLTLARSARETLRGRDVVGRLGGDEFIALLPETSVDDALHVANRMVREIDILRESQRACALSLSFGVVQMLPEETLDQAIRRADHALAEAKHQQREPAAGDPAMPDKASTSQGQPLGLT